jgi:hypothetical protein
MTSCKPNNSEVPLQACMRNFTSVLILQYANKLTEILL